MNLNEKEWKINFSFSKSQNKRTFRQRFLKRSLISVDSKIKQRTLKKLDQTLHFKLIQFKTN